MKYETTAGVVRGVIGDMIGESPGSIDLSSRLEDVGLDTDSQLRHLRQSLSVTIDEVLSENQGVITSAFRGSNLLELITPKTTIDGIVTAVLGVWGLPGQVIPPPPPPAKKSK